MESSSQEFGRTSNPTSYQSSFEGTLTRPAYIYFLQLFSVRSTSLYDGPHRVFTDVWISHNSLTFIKLKRLTHSYSGLRYLSFGYLKTSQNTQYGL